MDYSPALSVNSDFTDEELDQYFANCVPLSNLPTPPPAKEPTVVVSYQTYEPELHAYATHLANLVPRNASTARPQVPIIRSFLERSNLPDEVIAFAACVLDALSDRFTATWKEAQMPCYHTHTARGDAPPNHSVSPDIIVLVALVLAHGFLADGARTSLHWVQRCEAQCTVRELEATKRAVLQDMDYGFLRISHEMVTSMLRRIETLPEKRAERKHGLSISLKGTAMWNQGLPTPEPSP